MKFRPLNDGVLVKPATNNSGGGIIIPETTSKTPDRGEVVAVGPGARDEYGELITPKVKVGDQVLFVKGGTEVTIDGQRLLFFKESDLLGVVANYDHVLDELRLLAKYRDGWDGPGSKAADAISFDLAESFLRLVPDLSPFYRASAMIYAPGTAGLRIISDERCAA